MNEEKDVIEINLWKLIQYYCKKWWAIFVSGAVLALCAFLVSSQLITPMYSTNLTIYVNNARNGVDVEYISGSNLSASQKLVNTYIHILNSTSVLNKVIEEGELDYTPAQLREIISAEQVEETELFQVTVTCSDPDIAAEIADAIGKAAPGMIAELVDGSSARVIDQSGNPTVPSSPNISRNTVLGGLLGVILAAVALTLRYLFDFRLRDEADITQYFDAPVLGSIPSYKQSGGRPYGGYGYVGRNVQGGNK